MKNPGRRQGPIFPQNGERKKNNLVGGKKRVSILREGEEYSPQKSFCPKTGDSAN